jgi:3-methyladenine DNA glycosylase AlkD
MIAINHGPAPLGRNIGRKCTGYPAPRIEEDCQAIKIDQELSLALWKTKFHEARLFASVIGYPDKVTEEQFDNWTSDFNSQELCDQVCGNLFDRTPYAVGKAIEYSINDKKFIKRTGFVSMPAYIVHAKKPPMMYF